MNLQDPNPLVSRKEAIQRCMQSLIHSCSCRDAICQLRSCQRMKRVIQHTRVCRLKINGNCPICKQLIALCFYHGKYCYEQNCAFPLCSAIKQKIREQRFLRTKLRRRCMGSR